MSRLRKTRHPAPPLSGAARLANIRRSQQPFSEPGAPANVPPPPTETTQETSPATAPAAFDDDGERGLSVWRSSSGQAGICPQSLLAGQDDRRARLRSGDGSEGSVHAEDLSGSVSESPPRRIEAIAGPCLSAAPRNAADAGQAGRLSDAASRASDRVHARDRFDRNELISHMEFRDKTRPTDRRRNYRARR